VLSSKHCGPEEQAPVFEVLTPTPPVVEIASPAQATWSVETMLNLAALLLVLGLGCSVLVPSEPGWSEDDGAFFVGDAMVAPAYSIAHCLLVVVVVVASTAALLSILVSRERPRDNRQPVIDVTTDTGGHPTAVLTPAHAATLTTEQPPMATMIEPEAADIVWIESPYSAANVRFLQSHHARWCSGRNCWYMLAAPHSLDVVLERFDSRSEPQPTRVGRYKKATCTYPCYKCPTPSPSTGRSYSRRRRQPSATTPLFLLTLITCMVPSDAAAESMFTHHMCPAPWQMRAIYGVGLVIAAGKLLKRLYNDGALAAIATAIGATDTAITATTAATLCALLRRVDASAITIDAFMDNVRKRHSRHH
jgi:hypothetical protein